MTDTILDSTMTPSTRIHTDGQTLQALNIQKIAVLGAGVMGAQIAAHCANAGYEVLLFDLGSTASGSSMLAERAIAGLKKLAPSPLVNADWSRFVHAKNYEDHIQELSTCDLIIEAIAERVDWKQDLYQKISSHLHEKAILCTNTSGLSISELSKSLSKSLQTRFCGVHFFNPPRYLPLIELVPSPKISPELLDGLETFLVSRLGKNVVRAKDTPNFIGNRIGVFALLVALHYAEIYDIRLDVVDLLTGPAIGHPKSATLRTLDIVGLDTFAHVVNTMATQLKDDPWHALFKIPSWMAGMVERGSLGQKTGAGVYKREGKEFFVFDIKEDEYRPSTGQAQKEVMEILKIKDPVQKFKKLSESKEPEAQFLWAYHRDLWHYSAYHMNSIADNARDVDQAMRWGFAWKQGPFEQWQAAGWAEMAQLINQDIAKDKTFAPVGLPDWVTLKHDQGAYSAKGAYSLETDSYQPRRRLPVYQRQLFPEPMPGEIFDEGETLFENDFVRLWQQSEPVAILSFKSKMASISRGILDGIVKALAVACERSQAMVIWQRAWPNFSVGADITEFLAGINREDYETINQTLIDFQNMCLKIRSAPIPVVAALKGYVFGGGCELAMHCDRRVAASETYMGLVEPGVGLVPAGGGCKELILRASRAAGQSDPMPWIKKYFEQVAYAKASTSAQEAKLLGYLEPVDTIVMNADELLYVAKQVALNLVQTNYTPPRSEPIKVVGDNGWAQMETLLVNLAEGSFISQHDYLIAHHLAKIFAGGIIDSNSLVDETWLLRLERESFVELAATPETKARIEHMLQTGKPLRN